MCGVTQNKDVKMLVHVPPKAFRYHPELVHGFQRSRKRIFADRMNWKVRVFEDREFDEFDDEYAHYIVSIYNNEVIGGVRLTPSLSPNLTYDTFCQYFEDIEILVKRRSTLLESSRFGLEAVPNMESDFLRKETIDLFVSMLKFAIQYGYTDIITVVDTRMERVLRLVGWPIKRITEVVQIGDTKTIVGLLSVSQDIIRTLESKNKTHQSNGGQYE